MIQPLSKYTSYIFTFLLTLGMIFGISTYAATPEKTLGFQGQLFESNTPKTGSVNATFTFYDAPTGGNTTGTPIAKTVTVNNGYFGTQFTESDTTGVDFNQQLYVEVSINGTTLSPRTTINPTVSSLKSFGTFSYASAPTVGPVGSLYFNSTSGELYVSNGTSWQLAGLASSTTQWVANGTSLNYMAGNVGVGTSNPVGKFEVSSGSSSISAGDFVVDTNNKTVYVGRISSVSGDNSSFYVRNRLGTNNFGIDGTTGRTFASMLSVGTTSNSNAVLYVSSSIANPAIFERNTSGNVSIQFRNTIGSMNMGLVSGTNNFAVGASSDLALSSVLTVTSSSTVGIGAATPESLLHIKGSNPVLTLTDSRNTTFTAGDQMSAINFTSDDVSNSLQGQTRARISVLQGDTFGAVQNMGFSTYSDSGALTEHLRIMYNGRVGIGTTTPMSKLNVSIANGASVNDGLMINRGGSASGIGVKHISSAGGVYRSSLTSLFGGIESEIITFGYNGSTNVGIGTTTPGTAFVIGNGQITVPNGSGSLPSYSFSNSSNDGMYLVAPGQLAFGTAGGERLRINSANLTYQGAASGFAIQLTGTSGTTPVFIPNRSDTTTGIGANQSGVLSFISSSTERMTITNTGNVGIGTSTPSAKFTLIGSGTGTGKNIQAFNSSGTETFSVTDAGSGYFASSVTIIGNLDMGGTGAARSIGRVRTLSNDEAAGITLNATAASSSLRFNTSGSERMRILDNGSVAIGASSTTYFTEAYKSQNAATRLAVTNDSTDLAAMASLLASNGATNDEGVEIRAFGTGFLTSGGNIQNSAQIVSGPSLLNGMSLVTRAGDMRFYSGGNLDANLRMTILSSGNIGIGTSTPGAKLDINGDVRAGYFIATSTSATSTLAGALNISSNNAYPLTIRPSSSAAGGLALFEYISGNAFIAISGNANGSSVINFGTPSNRALGAISYRNDALASRPNFMTFSTAGSERMVIDASGNVGIGTSTPNAKLDVLGAIKAGNAALSTPSNTALYARDSGSSASTWKGRIVAGGDNVAFLMGEYNSQAWLGGHSAALNAWAPLRINPDGASDLYLGNTYGGGAGVAPIVTIKNSGGNVGIGTTTPTTGLVVATGTIQSTALYGGATTLSTDANGNIIRTPSDQKLKTNVETLTSALDKVNAMRGVSYNWIDTNRFGPDKEIGFIARELETIVPEVVKSGGEYKSVNYQNLTALLTEAIKELSSKFDNLSEVVKTKFVDAEKVKANEVQADKLCLGTTCVTEDQHRQLLLQSNSHSTPPPSTPAHVEESEPSPEPAPNPEPVPEPTSETSQEVQSE